MSQAFILALQANIRWFSLDAEPLPDCFEAYAKTIRDLNPDGGLRWYPGSPWLVAQALRPGDRFIAVEAHPEEARLLRETLRQTRYRQLGPVGQDDD